MGNSKIVFSVVIYTRMCWDLTSKNVTFNEGRINIKRILSLLANKKYEKYVLDSNLSSDVCVYGILPFLCISIPYYRPI